jgi:hypothetical protein
MNEADFSAMNHGMILIALAQRSCECNDRSYHWPQGSAKATRAGNDPSVTRQPHHYLHMHR